MHYHARGRLSFANQSGRTRSLEQVVTWVGCQLGVVKEVRMIRSPGLLSLSFVAFALLAGSAEAQVPLPLAEAVAPPAPAYVDAALLSRRSACFQERLSLMQEAPSQKFYLRLLTPPDCPPPPFWRMRRRMRFEPSLAGWPQCRVDAAAAQPSDPRKVIDLRSALLDQTWFSAPRHYFLRTTNSNECIGAESRHEQSFDGCNDGLCMRARLHDRDGSDKRPDHSGRRRCAHGNT